MPSSDNAGLLEGIDAWARPSNCRLKCCSAAVGVIARMWRQRNNEFQYVLCVDSAHRLFFVSSLNLVILSSGCNSAKYNMFACVLRYCCEYSLNTLLLAAHLCCISFEHRGIASWLGTHCRLGVITVGVITVSVVFFGACDVGCVLIFVDVSLLVFDVGCVLVFVNFSVCWGIVYT